MEKLLMDVATPQGIFAVLFVFLFLYMLRENNSREKRYIDRENKYQSLIETLTSKYDMLKIGIDKLEDKFDNWIKR